jgi:protein required for attachment to host cells
MRGTARIIAFSYVRCNRAAVPQLTFVKARSKPPAEKRLRECARRRRMLIPHGTLIAVADGTKAELFRNDGDEANVKLSALPKPDVHAHGRDSGGRHRSSTANHAKHLQEEDAFAAAFVAFLNHETIANKVEHLIVIAAPRALGEMRRHYHVTLKSKLIGELAKELTAKSPETIVHELKLAHPHH